MKVSNTYQPKETWDDFKPASRGDWATVTPGARDPFDANAQTVAARNLCVSVKLLLYEYFNL